MNILLVEDNAMLAEITEINLNNTFPGSQVRLAPNRVDTFQLLESFTPNVAIIDHTLPDGDGASLIQPILQRNSTCKIIVTSGMLSPYFSDEVRAMGANIVLTKPYEMKDLNEAIVRPVAPAMVSADPKHFSQITIGESERLTHRIMNKLSSVMTGLRLLQLEIEEDLSGEAKVKSQIIGHIDKMVDVISETSFYITKNHKASIHDR